MIEVDRLVSSQDIKDDANAPMIRPKTLKDYIGQDEIVSQMDVFIQASRERNESLDHVLILVRQD